MDLGLAGATAVVVGGSKGMGLATARCLAEDGALVAVVGRSATDVADAAAGLTGRGSPDAIGLSADVCDSAAIRAVFGELAERWGGGLNILIIVMNDGRVEQSGGPRDLYEDPASEFVMSFVGPAHRLGEACVRPHDIEIRHEPNGRTIEAMVERIVHLGFEVRVELSLPEGENFSVQLTRDEVDQLELRECQIVFVRPRSTRVFGPDGNLEKVTSESEVS